MMGKRLPRPTAEQIAEVGEILVSLDGVEFDVSSDELVTMWLPTPSGQVQPVFWPLPEHVHTHECFRA